MIDGLVLPWTTRQTGPHPHGTGAHPHTRPMPVRREDFDRRLCKMAVEMKIPTVAIGLGMQTLNVVCGGSLLQRVQEDVPKALHHRDPVEKHNRHIINIVEGTKCWDIYGPGEIRVNSDHHMAINQLAPQFRATAHAPDGVVEFYESQDPNGSASASNSIRRRHGVGPRHADFPGVSRRLHRRTAGRHPHGPTPGGVMFIEL